MVIEKLFNDIFSFSSDFIILLDSSGKVIRFNDATKHFFQDESKIQNIVSEIFPNSNNNIIKFKTENTRYEFIYKLVDINNEQKILILKPLLEHFDFYNKIFPNIPIALVIFGKEGNIRCWNNYYLEMWGIKEDDLVNYNIFHDSRLKALGFIERINEVFQGKPILFLEGYFDTLLEKGKGYRIWLESILFPLVINNDEIEGVVAIHKDISELKLAQEEIKVAKDSADEANRLKNAFLQNLSHEIRTPLNSILGFSDLISELVKNRIEEDEYELIENFRKGTKRLYRMLTQLLELSQIESGNYEIKIEPVEILEEIQKIKNDFDSEVKSKGLDLVLNCDNNFEFVLADKPALNKILTNLVENAIKFTDNGYIKIETYPNNSQNLLFISIKDTGIGMSEKYLDHIFEPFSQEETGFSRSFEGTGLGLALTKRYLDLMNGSITVNSVKGVGTTFTFTLPIYKSNE